MKNKLNIRYIVELVITLLLILFITVVLVRMFVYSRGRTVYAQDLTEAVRISESMAELSAGIPDRNRFEDTVSGLEHVSSVSEEDGEIVVKLYGTERKSGVPEYEVRISWEEEDGEAGRLIRKEIAVYPEGSSQAIYSLSTGNYAGE